MEHSTMGWAAAESLLVGALLMWYTIRFKKDCTPLGILLFLVGAAFLILAFHLFTILFG